MQIRAREPVVFAEDFASLVAWYVRTLGFSVARMEEERYHYANLESSGGVQLGIADAKEMGVEPADRSRNTVVLQLEVPDVRAFLALVGDSGGRVIFGASQDRDDGFWYGGFADPEGNPFWVVDETCP